MKSISRRSFGAFAAGTIAVAASSPALGKQALQTPLQGEKYLFKRPRSNARPKVAMLTFPGLTLLDLVGPHTALSAHCDIHLVWKNTDAMMSDSGVILRADTLVEDCPRDLDILFIPGGPGQEEIMRDDALLRFIADRGARAKYVTSVCSGALVLGSAGLLQGYEAATHWAAMDLLPLFGAKPVDQRVVKDRNRITGGGVTAGLDFGLALLAEIAGETVAKVQQLSMQYDPHPPFDTGTPAKAGPELTKEAIDWMVAGGIDMRKVSKEAASVMSQYTSNRLTN